MDKLSFPTPQMLEAGKRIFGETWSLNSDTQQSLRRLRDDIHPLPNLVSESFDNFLNSAEEKLTQALDQSFNIGKALITTAVEAKDADEHIAGAFDSQPPGHSTIRTF